MKKDKVFEFQCPNCGAENYLTGTKRGLVRRIFKCRNCKEDILMREHQEKEE